MNDKFNVLTSQTKNNIRIKRILWNDLAKEFTRLKSLLFILSPGTKSGNSSPQLQEYVTEHWSETAH